MAQNGSIRRPRGRTRGLVYDYIVEYVERKGYPPTLREIADALGLRSTGTVVRHLKHLEADCLITRQERMARAISTHELKL